jgi:hypothetical protein
VNKHMIIRGDKIQAWVDKYGKHHVVLALIPNRLVCLSTPMYGYHPRLYLISQIDCELCRNAIE